MMVVDTLSSKNVDTCEHAFHSPIYSFRWWNLYKYTLCFRYSNQRSKIFVIYDSEDMVISLSFIIIQLNICSSIPFFLILSKSDAKKTNTLD